MPRNKRFSLVVVVWVVMSGLAVPSFAQCEKPPSDYELNFVFITCCGDPIAVAPGTSGPVQLTYFLDGEFRDYTGCATWSVDPPAYVSIEAATGVLTTSANAPDGHVFYIVANFQNGRRLIAAHGLVVESGRNPLRGAWTERARYACGSGQPMTNEPRMQELIFRADGTFTVTLVPIELYIDYRGRYIADYETGRLTLQVTGGNHVFEKFDGYGRFRIDESGRLVVTGLSFGRYPEDRRPACKYIFERPGRETSN
jgi:hypothetical protein